MVGEGSGELGRVGSGDVGHWSGSGVLGDGSGNSCGDQEGEGSGGGCGELEGEWSGVDGGSCHRGWPDASGEKF